LVVPSLVYTYQPFNFVTKFISQKHSLLQLKRENKMHLCQSKTPFFRNRTPTKSSHYTCWAKPNYSLKSGRPLPTTQQHTDPTAEQLAVHHPQS
jgi:hypothetical protein